MNPTPSLYLALLRGINVGGNNIIKMSALKESFESLAFTNVSTFIASGNVLFSSPLTSEDELEQKIEQALSKTFRYNSRLVVIKHATLKRVVKEAPPEFKQDSSAYRCDVIFLKKPLTPSQAMKILELREGVDKAYQGKHALYFSRLAAQASRSRLPKLIAKPEYQYMTIRNWNTTTKLLALMDANK